MKKLLESTLPVVVSLALTVAAIAAAALIVGHVRQSDDAAWCRKVTPTVIKVKGVDQPVQPEQLASARTACVAERRSERGMFGAVWKTGGQEMADCGVDWGRYQQISGGDPAGATATVVKPYGITGSLDPGSRTDQQRFMTACLAKKRSQ